MTDLVDGYVLVAYFGFFLAPPSQLHSNIIVSRGGGAGQVYNVGNINFKGFFQIQQTYGDWRRYF